MAIEKYTTEAFVLTDYEQGEHDKVFKLFTREFGMLYALAKSVRKLESKLRYHLDTSKKISVTLVKGKEVWRLTGVESLGESSKNTAIACQIVERFVRGEGAQKKLFDHVSEFSLLKDETLPRDVGMLALYYVLLVDLGYADGSLGGAKDIEEFFSFSLTDHFTHILLHKAVVKSHVHTVMAEMQL